MQVRILCISMLIAFSITLIGCKSSITDLESKQMPPLMDKKEVKAEKSIFQFRSDAMQRDGKFPINLVVDNVYYQQNEIKRGDIVYIELPEEIVRQTHEKYGKKSTDETIENKNVEFEREQALRVVGLPKEIVSINQGQVAINGTNLDTFYGREYFGDKVQDKNKAETMKQDVKLGDNQYFVLADQWWRSAYSSNIIGAIPKEYIRGKVIGYVEE